MDEKQKQNSSENPKKQEEEDTGIEILDESSEFSGTDSEDEMAISAERFEDEDPASDDMAINAEFEDDEDDEDEDDEDDDEDEDAASDDMNISAGFEDEDEDEDEDDEDDDEDENAASDDMNISAGFEDEDDEDEGDGMTISAGFDDEDDDISDDSVTVSTASDSVSGDIVAVSTEDNDNSAKNVDDDSRDGEYEDDTIDDGMTIGAENFEEQDSKEGMAISAERFEDQVSDDGMAITAERLKDDKDSSKDVEAQEHILAKTEANDANDDDEDDDEDDEGFFLDEDSLPCELEISISGDRLGSPFFDQDIIRIGRGAECDVVIDNLGASRVHAEIKRYGKFYAIHNMGKTGTFVNGKKVDEYNLNNGDEIFLAKHSIVFRRFSRDLLEKKGAKAKTPKKSSSLPMGDERIQTISVDFKTMAKKQGPASAYLHIESKANRPLPVYKNATFFGKSSKCDIIIQGWLISERHALLVQEESGYALYHLGFFKPPLVNQEAKPFVVLKDGDLVEIGNTRFVFQIMPGGN